MPGAARCYHQLISAPKASKPKDTVPALTNGVTIRFCVLKKMEKTTIDSGETELSNQLPATAEWTALALSAHDGLPGQMGRSIRSKRRLQFGGTHSRQSPEACAEGQKEPFPESKGQCLH